MRKKRLTLAAAISAVLACAVCVAIAFIPGGPGVSKANFNRLEDGMTKADVEVVFGRAPDMELPGAKLGNANEIFAWTRDEGFAGAILVFDQDHRVIQKEWRDQTLLGRVRSLLPF